MRIVQGATKQRKYMVREEVCKGGKKNEVPVDGKDQLLTGGGYRKNQGKKDMIISLASN